MKPKERFNASGKLRAFLIHIIASALVVGSIGALMWSLWFPQPWFMHDGGWQVYQLILLVDVILGPLLTLIVFRQEKPGLQRDITIIVAVQLGALAFGTGTMYQYRPAFIVYGDSNFFSVTLNEVRRNTRDLGRLERFVPDRGPGIVILRPPSAPKDQSLFRALRSTDGTVYVCLEGGGEVQVGDTTWRIQPNDVFVVPSWHTLQVRADQDTVLFSFSDRPVQQAMGLWREERC